PLQPTSRYTTEHRDMIDKDHPGDFLWPGERNLMHHFMCIQNQGFAWNDSQRGSPSCKILPLVPGCSHKNCYILRGSSHGCGTGACLGLLGCVPGINWFSYPINPLF